MVAAYREAGGAAVDGFRRVMRGVMDEQTRDLLEPRGAPPLPAAAVAASGGRAAG